MRPLLGIYLVLVSGALVHGLFQVEQKESQDHGIAGQSTFTSAGHRRILQTVTNSKPESTLETALDKDAWPEPEPEWTLVFHNWKWAWHIHVYPFATFFLAVACYSCWFIAHNMHTGLHERYLPIALNLMMFILGSTRALSLYFDPYLQGNLITEHEPMRILWSIANPCLTSADSLLILTLIEVSRISLIPPRLQKLKYVSAIIVVHFTLVLISDLVVSRYTEAKVMLLFCQLVFIAWGTTLGVGYCIMANKLDKKLFRHKKRRTRNDRLDIQLIYASGISNFFLAGIYVYSCFGVFGVYSDAEYVDAWPWWIFQTCLRLNEAAASVLIFSVSDHRKKIKAACDEQNAPPNKSDDVSCVAVIEHGSGSASEGAPLPGQVSPVSAEKSVSLESYELDFFSELERARAAAYYAQKEACKTEGSDETSPKCQDENL